MAAQRNPEETRRTVVEAAAVLFNQQGYRATSLSDITTQSGLTKGAIYQHFHNKEALELQAFDTLFARSMEAFAKVIRAQPDAPTKLRAAIGFYQTYVLDPVTAGGCPLLNAGVEADDAHPALRERALAMLTSLRSTLERLLARGIQEGQLLPTVRPKQDALMILAILEGGIMIGRLSRDPLDMRDIVAYLEQWLDSHTA